MQVFARALSARGSPSDDAVPPLSRPASALVNEPKVDHWACSRCTFLNFHLLTSCEMCGTDKIMASPNASIASPLSRTHSIGDDEVVVTVIDDDGKEDEGKTTISDTTADPEAVPEAAPEAPPLVRASSLGETVLRVASKLLKSVSTLGQETEFYCAICQSHCPLSEIAPALACPDHKFCQDCLEMYFAFEIREGRVLNVCCPGRTMKPGSVAGGVGTACKYRIKSDAIKETVDADVFEKYERFYQLKKSNDNRQCDKCNHIQMGNARNPIMICENDLCGNAYCFIHNDSHEPTIEACKEFEQKTKLDFARAKSFIDKSSIECPRCGCNIYKHSGCNHMTCTQCQSNFCYLCGGRYMDGLHFNELNVFGCPGGQFEAGGPNSRNTAQDNTRRMLCAPLGIALCACPAAMLFGYFALIFVLWILFLTLLPFNGICRLLMWCRDYLEHGVLHDLMEFITCEATEDDCEDCNDGFCMFRNACIQFDEDCC